MAESSSGEQGVAIRSTKTMTVREAFAAARASRKKGAGCSRFDASAGLTTTKEKAEVPVCIPTVVVAVLGAFGALYVGLDTIDHLSDGGVRMVDGKYRGIRAAVAIALVAAYVLTLQLLCQFGHPRIGWGIALTFPALWLLFVLVVFPLTLFDPKEPTHVPATSSSNR